jgi:hypothetical protein
MNGALTMNSRYTKGSAEILGGHITTKTVLSGHYDCHETLIGNCGTPSATFAYLVVVVGALLFAVYAVRLRKPSSGLPEELRPENVVVDKEGWETKASDKKKRKISNDKENREQKSEG